jgi:hypothetical protein
MQKITLLYWNHLSFSSEFASGAYANVSKELNKLPLKMKVTEMTVLLYNTGLWTYPMYFVSGLFAEDDLLDNYIAEGLLHSNIMTQIQGNDTTFAVLTPNNDIRIVGFQPKEDEVWTSWTTHLNSFIDGTKYQPIINTRFDTITGSAQAAGSMDYFIILEVEIY